MSEQAVIIGKIQELVMDILKKGIATPEEGEKLDALEDLLEKQKCFQAPEGSKFECLGEEIADLFFNNKFSEAVKKLEENEITPEDFFGFAEYHIDEDEIEEIEMFTQRFIDDVKKAYKTA